MKVKLPKSIVRLASIPLAVLAGTLVISLGSSHVYADDAQAASEKSSNGLSLNLFTRDSDGGLNLTPSVSVSTPLLDVEVPSIKADASAGKLSVSELKVDTPLGSAGTSEIGIDANKGTVELPSVQADTPVIRADVSSSQVNLNEGTASLPSVTAEVPEVIQAETSAVKTDLRQGKVELPSVKVNVPEVASVDVSSSGVDLSKGKVQLPSVEATVSPVGISTEVDPGKGSVDIPAVKLESPVNTSEQPVVVETTQVPALNTTESTDPVSSRDNEEGQDVAQVTGKVTEVTPEPTIRPEVIPQALPVEGVDLIQHSDVNVGLPDTELFRIDQPFVKPIVTEQVQSKTDASVEKADNNAVSPLQPRAEQSTSWNVAVTSPAAVSGYGGTSSSSSGASGGGATAQVVALPGAITNLVLSDNDVGFRIEQLDGFSQWSQAPPGRPPQYTSFSQ
ncbi:hypothetical protein [Paenibacillus sp. MER 99-2]|uniref:hypothetical protein n=1 Tax=Paenibacillus sp. MER 99-2 TaxID=2939572 RepID=UPI00204080D7|nr:hypothetical protein [Paenibacillus sp. MER 99-2]MCM3175757.1 hypothetical protein [Paenibacillus sp. MER 99-2]